MSIVKDLINQIVRETTILKESVESHIRIGTIGRDIYEKPPEDFKRELIESIQKNTGKTFEINDVVITQGIPRIWVLCEWTKYKKIYDLDPCFATLLENTEDRPIEKELFKRLPFTSFFISWGERKDDSGGELGLDKTYGMFVRVMLVSETINIGMYVFGRKEGEPDMTGFTVVVPLKDGYNFGTEADSDSVDIKCWKPFIRIAFNVCQYLCASNAEIRPVKTTKKEKPVAIIRGKRKPITVDRYEVGYRIGQKFEKMYEEASGESVGSLKNKTWKQIKAHVRRAHWHHFWAGKGKQTLIVKWLEPIFVVGNSERIDVVSHEVSGPNNTENISEMQKNRH